MSERVEQALEETKELMKQLESKIRAGGGAQSLVETSLHTVEPASMLRQVYIHVQLMHIIIMVAILKPLHLLGAEVLTTMYVIIMR